jgi:hypothetical protein
VNRDTGRTSQRARQILRQLAEYYRNWHNDRRLFRAYLSEDIQFFAGRNGCKSGLRLGYCLLCHGCSHTFDSALVSRRVPPVITNDQILALSFPAIGAAVAIATGLLAMRVWVSSVKVAPEKEPVQSKTTTLPSGMTTTELLNRIKAIIEAPPPARSRAQLSEIYPNPMPVPESSQAPANSLEASEAPTAMTREIYARQRDRIFKLQNDLREAQQAAGEILAEADHTIKTRRSE